MTTPPAPRVAPWVLLGMAVGAIAAAVIGLAAWGRAGDVETAADVTLASTVAVSGTTIIFGVVIGLAVGQFIRVAGVVTAWRPGLPTMLDTPPPSSNGHGRPEGGTRGPATNGAIFAVLSALGAILAGPIVVPLLPAPIVLGVGALALDERIWVRVTASAGVFVAGMSLAGFLVTSVVDGRAGGPLFLAAIVAIGVVEFLLVRRVHPRR